MKVKTLSALAGLGGAMILSGSANAAYVGLVVVSTNHAPVVGGTPVPITVHKVYALFTDPNDRLLTWGGGGQFGAAGFESRNTLDTGAGSNFRNFGANGNTAPSIYNVGLNPNLAFDSFFGINGTRSDDYSPANGGALIVSQGTPDLGTAADSGLNSFTFPASGGAFAITPTLPTGAPSPITFAGFAGADAGVPPLSIFLMQLTVNAGDHVRGTIGVIINNASLAGGDTVLGGQTFNSIPAPGALALLGVAGLIGSRRRRA